MAVSVAVCEIFCIKEWRDFENRVRVRSRSLIAHLIAHQFLFTFHSNYRAILYHLRDVATYWSKITIFLYPTYIFSPPPYPAGGDPDAIL